MEFLNKNFILTSTMIAVQSNTITAEYIMNNDKTYQYVSSGYDNDLTTTTLTINFNETQTVERIALLGMNLKGFTIYYDGTTANTFSLSTTSDTTVSDYSSNSSTAKYLAVTPQACTSVSIDMKSTIVADVEKALGYFILSDQLINFERDPSAKNYKPRIIPKEVKHVLSDGGVRIQNIETNWEVQIKYEYIAQSFRDSLKTVYDLRDDFIFAAFPTTTGWDEVIFPCVWSGNFDFYKYSDNAPQSGFSGSMILNEIPS